MQPAKVTNAAKLRKITAQFPGLPKAAGLRDSVTLTTRNPVVDTVANLEFMLPFIVKPREDYVDFGAYLASGDSPFAGFVMPALIVNLTVFHANKPHLLTIYIDSSHDQTYHLSNFSTAVGDAGPIDLESGPSTVLFAFLPVERGQHRFAFAPQLLPDVATRSFDFSRVEIDVVI